jgi:hypothetical protein
LAVKAEAKRELARFRLGREDNIKMYLKEIVRDRED